MSLSPAATIVLARAAAHPDHHLEFHRKLPTAARHKMIDALLRDGMIAETVGDYHFGAGASLNLEAATGLLLTTLAITDAGFRAIGQEPATVAEAAPPAASDEAVAQERLSACHARCGAASVRYWHRPRIQRWRGWRRTRREPTGPVAIRPAERLAHRSEPATGGTVAGRC